jgi:ABC-type polysaccharide/polyol phosphate transport system ATPase subunit
MTEPRVSIENVSVSYFLRRKISNASSARSGSVGGQMVRRGGVLEIQALRNVSLSIDKGERVGLIGRNGAGKSTFLKLCSRALSAQEGRVEINGKICPQFALGAGIRPTLTGRKNAELKALYMGVGQRRLYERVEAVKELSGLEEYFDLPVESYSTGMRSRLVMSMMHLIRGDVLIMDEWINAADASINETANRLQEALIEKASIIMLASHSQRVLRQWTTRCVWFEKGRIVADGPTKDVLAYYSAGRQ